MLWQQRPPLPSTPYLAAGGGGSERVSPSLLVSYMLVPARKGYAPLSSSASTAVTES